MLLGAVQILTHLDALLRSGRVEAALSGYSMDPQTSGWPAVGRLVLYAEGIIDACLAMLLVLHFQLP